MTSTVKKSHDRVAFEMKSKQAQTQINRFLKKVHEKHPTLELDIDRIEHFIEGKDDFWSDSKVAKDTARKLSNMKDLISDIDSLSSLLSETIELHDLSILEDDQEMITECNEKMDTLLKDIIDKEVVNLMTEPYDKLNCFVQINAGAGGNDSCDWVGMLAIMYQKWCINRNISIVTVDEHINDEIGSSSNVGYRSITLKLNGEYSYGWLRAEAGVHRLVRVSPYDSQKKRHTSFAQVLVYPELLDDDIFSKDISMKDLHIDTFRSSGAGGQHVNKTDSAIRITHLPTGIVVKCQSERSQHRNKAIALSMLNSKLNQIVAEKKYQKQQQSVVGGGDSSWGNQIRSIVLHPYKLVKDHRTGFQTGNVDSFLDGEELLTEAMVETLSQSQQTQT